MIKIEYRDSYCLLEYEDFSDFNGNPNDTFDWICMMNDLLQIVLSKVTIAHPSFKLIDDALDLWEQLQELRIRQGQEEIKE